MFSKASDQEEKEGQIRHQRDIATEFPERKKAGKRARKGGMATRQNVNCLSPFDTRVNHQLLELR